MKMETDEKIKRYDCKLRFSLRTESEREREKERERKRERVRKWPTNIWTERQRTKYCFPKQLGLLTTQNKRLS